MATKKAATKKPASTSAKKAAPKKSAASTTTVRTVSAAEPVARPVKKAAPSRLNNNVLNVVLAEIVGTFVLTLVALSTAAEVVPLFVGLTLALLVMTIGAISGSHVNPAVTLGLWAAGKVKPLMIPFYWCAQVLGAIGAFVVINLATSNARNLDFGHSLSLDWTIFAVEFLGTAIFLFGLVSVLSRVDMSNSGKAIGVGLSLFVAIVASNAFYANVPAAVETNYVKNLQEKAKEYVDKDGQLTADGRKKLAEVEVPRGTLVSGGVLNPAVAVAVTESKTADDVRQRVGLSASAPGQTEAPAKSQYSRFGIESVLGALLGGVVGAWVARLLNYRFSN